MKNSKPIMHFFITTLVVSLLLTPAAAAETVLRAQVIFGADTSPGKLVAQFVDDVQTMSNGEVKIEMNYGSWVVKGPETFDAAVSGVLDCDMTTGSYQTGKNPAFQFVSNIMGGYSTPYQQLSWLYFGDGLASANKLYHQYDMHLIGWWVHGMESLASTRPLRGPADLAGWKFRLPQGMGHEIFAEFGASPINMGFGEVLTGLETGLIEGADASDLSTNAGLGLYDVAKHTNYPGFHSMRSSHLACNKKRWDSLPAHHRRIIETAMQKLALQTAMTTEVKNTKAAATLPMEKGLNIYDWSPADRAAFRAAALKAWERWAEKSPEARELVDSHVRYMKSLGLL